MYEQKAEGAFEYNTGRHGVGKFRQTPFNLVFLVFFSRAIAEDVYSKTETIDGREVSIKLMDTSDSVFRQVYTHIMHTTYLQSSKCNHRFS